MPLSVPNRFDQQTLAALAGYDGRPTVATAQHPRLEIQPQATLHFVGLPRVTRITLSLQCWLNFFPKELHALCVSRANRDIAHDHKTKTRQRGTHPAVPGQSG